jgi:hypothetical protein
MHGPGTSALTAGGAMPCLLLSTEAWPATTTPLPPACIQCVACVTLPCPSGIRLDDNQRLGTRQGRPTEAWWPAMELW